MYWLFAVSALSPKNSFRFAFPLIAYLPPDHGASADRPSKLPRAGRRLSGPGLRDYRSVGRRSDGRKFIIDVIAYHHGVVECEACLGVALVPCKTGRLFGLAAATYSDGLLFCCENKCISQMYCLLPRRFALARMRPPLKFYSSMRTHAHAIEPALSSGHPTAKSNSTVPYAAGVVEWWQKRGRERGNVDVDPLGITFFFFFFSFRVRLL